MRKHLRHSFFCFVALFFFFSFIVPVQLAGSATGPAPDSSEALLRARLNNQERKAAISPTVTKASASDKPDFAAECQAQADKHYNGPQHRALMEARQQAVADYEATKTSAAHVHALYMRMLEEQRGKFNIPQSEQNKLRQLRSDFEGSEGKIYDARARAEDLQGKVSRETMRIENALNQCIEARTTAFEAQRTKERREAEERRREAAARQLQEAATAGALKTQKAAEQGDAEAQNELGSIYLKGLGVTKDEGKAVQWYQKAAEQGNTLAQINLGLMYEEGKGVVQDKTTALQWYRRAAKLGDAKAHDLIADIIGDWDCSNFGLIMSDRNRSNTYHLVFKVPSSKSVSKVILDDEYNIPTFRENSSRAFYYMQGDDILHIDNLNRIPNKISLQQPSGRICNIQRDRSY